MNTFEQFQRNEGASGPGLGTLKETAGVFLFFLAIFLTLFSPVLFTGQLMAPDDGFVQNLANFFGRRSLWTLSIYSGYPLVADPIVQYFYPLPLLLAWLPQGWNIYVVSGYALTGTFLYLYLRMLTGSTFASVIGGVFFALSGYLMCETLHVHVVQIAMWYAATITIFEYLARAPQKAALMYVLGALAICGGSFNGQFQTLAYLLGVLTLYAPLRALSLPAGARPKYVITCYAMLATGLALSAVQLLPTAELAAFSSRKQFTFQDFLTYDMHPLEAFGVFLPFLFGDAPDGIISQPYFASFICPPHFVYLGYIPLFMSLSAVAGFLRNRLVVFWAVVGILTFLLCFGDFTPLAWMLYHMPLFGSFRCLHRILLVTALANSILAALAVAALEKGNLPRKKMIIPVATITFAFLGVLGMVSTLQGVLSGQAIKYGIKQLGVLPWTNPAIGSSTVLFALSLVATVAFALKPGKKWSRCLLTVITIFDLAFLGWYAQGGQWRLHSASLDKINPPPAAQKYVPLAAKGFNRILPVRGGSASWDELPNNLCRLWDVPSASGYAPLIMSRYGSLLNISEGGFLFPPWNYTGEDRCFDILSIKYATCEAGDDRLEKIVDKDGHSPWRKLETIGTASIHENTRALPRCWFVREAVPRCKESDVLKAIKTARMPDGKVFDPAQTALCEDWVFGDYWPDPAPNEGDKATILALKEDYIKIDVTNETRTMLVLSDIYYPWWKASIDGHEQPVFRVDYVLRGVVVDKGHHTVEFKLDPKSLHLGTALSGIAFLILIGGYGLLRWLAGRQGKSGEAAKGATGDVGKSL